VPATGADGQPCSETVTCDDDAAFFQPSCGTCAKVFPLSCAPLLADARTNVNRQLMQADDAEDRSKPDLPIQTPLQLSKMALLKPMDSDADTDAAEMASWWRLNYEIGDRQCSPGCELEKIRLCNIHPQMCINLRCEDLSLGRGLSEFSNLCAALASMDEPVKLGMKAEEIVFRWRLYHTKLPRVCGPECELHKIHMCHLHPHLCQALRCEDAATGHGDTSVIRACGEKTVAAALASGYNVTQIHPDVQQIKSMWRLHSTLGDRECGGGCKKFKTETCESDPMLCMELSCENAWSLLSDTSILDICSAFYPEQGPRVPAGALEVSEAEMREEWSQLSVISPDCGGACAAVKMELCPQHPATCLLLACSDAARSNDQSDTGMAPICNKMKLPELKVAQPSVSAARSAADYNQSTVVAIASEWYRVVSPHQECIDECAEFKLRTCIEHDLICLRLTCDDAARRGEAAMFELCEGVLPQLNVPQIPAGLYDRVANVAQADDDDKLLQQEAGDVAATKFGEGAVEIVDTWARQVSNKTVCGPVCQQYKLTTCLRRPQLCIQLTCEDTAARQDETPIAQLCRRVAVASDSGDAAVSEDDAQARATAVVSQARADNMRLLTMASNSTSENFRSTWNALEGADGSCDNACEEGKLAMCIARVPMCVIMRCADLRAGKSMHFADDPNIRGVCNIVSSGQVSGDSMQPTVDVATTQDALKLSSLPEFLFSVPTSLIPGGAVPANTTTVVETTDNSVPAKPPVAEKDIALLDSFKERWPVGSSCGTDCPLTKGQLCREHIVFCALMRCEDALAGLAQFAGDAEVTGACQEEIMSAENPIEAAVAALGPEKAVALLFDSRST